VDGKRPRQPCPILQLEIGIGVRYNLDPAVIECNQHMIFFSIGLSSRFAEWCDAVTGGQAQRSLGGVETVAANTIEELALAFIKTRSQHLVVGSRAPVGRLRAALIQANRRFILALDDPRLALHELVVRQGLDFVYAMRIVANSCASMVSCLSIPGALVLHGDQAAQDPLRTAASIAHHLELPSRKDEIADLVEELTTLDLTSERSEAASWWGGLDEARRTLINGALEAYALHFSDGTDLGTITWERDLFYMGKDPPEQPLSSASQPIDITGRPRALVFGPYINLPPGPWTATVTLGFSREAAEMSYIVDIMADVARQLTHVRVEPGNERILEVSLHFSIDDSLVMGIEVRVHNERAAFDGRLALGDVTFTTHGHIRSETREFINTALAG
jgi:hypothetical protein